MSEAYRKILIEAATEIHKLLVKHRAIFIEKVQKFVALFEQWRDAVVEGQLIALKYTKSKLAFYSGEDIPDTFKRPRGCKNYELYYLCEFYDADKSLPLKEHNEKLPFKGKHKDRNVRKRRHVYYGPPLPRNPMDTLRLRDWPCFPFNSDSGLYEKDPRDSEEDLLRKFFLLAVIHAFYNHGQPIIDRDSLAVQLVFEAYRHDDDYRVPDKQSLIDTALVDIRANLVDSKETTKKSESWILCEIADKLSAWRESVKEDKKNQVNWQISKLTKEGQRTARESLQLLFISVDLLHNCASAYEAKNSECREVLKFLDTVITCGINKPTFDYYVGQGYIFAIPGFISELRRWAKEHKSKPKRIPKLGKIPSLIYEKLITLPEHRAMPLPEITQWLWDEHRINRAESTVHQKYLKKLEPWGLQHDKRIGYSIDRNKKV